MQKLTEFVQVPKMLYSILSMLWSLFW